MIRESASEELLLDSNSKAFLISEYFSFQSTSEQEHLYVLCIRFACSKEPLHTWKVCKARRKSNAAMACSCWGLQVGKTFVKVPFRYTS